MFTLCEEAALQDITYNVITKSFFVGACWVQITSPRMYLIQALNNKIIQVIQDLSRWDHYETGEKVSANTFKQVGCIITISGPGFTCHGLLIAQAHANSPEEK